MSYDDGDRAGRTEDGRVARNVRDIVSAARRAAMAHRNVPYDAIVARAVALCGDRTDRESAKRACQQAIDEIDPD